MNKFKQIVFGMALAGAVASGSAFASDTSSDINKMIDDFKTAHAKYSNESDNYDNIKISFDDNDFSQLKLQYSHDKKLNKVITQCEMVINPKETLDMASSLSGLSHSDVATMTYLHESAHCMDFTKLNHSADIEKIAPSDGSLLDSIYKEGFADSVAILKMSAENPEMATKYISEMDNFRVSSAKKAGLTDNHDSSMAINNISKIWANYSADLIKLKNADKVGYDALVTDLAQMAAYDGAVSYAKNHNISSDFKSTFALSDVGDTINNYAEALSVDLTQPSISIQGAKNNLSRLRQMESQDVSFTSAPKSM